MRKAKIVPLIFADDLLIFSEASLDSRQGIKMVKDDFQSPSGLGLATIRVNFTAMVL